MSFFSLFLPWLACLLARSLFLPQVHPGFRLWLTSYPSPHFPASILRDGQKVMTERPMGIKANLKRTFSHEAFPVAQEGWYQSCQKEAQLRKMTFALAWFHALVQERRKYGPIGWTIPYGFDDSDFIISARQLKLLLSTPNSVPYAALRYLTGECNYGGRVTDNMDRRLLVSLLNNYYKEEVHAVTGFSLLPDASRDELPGDSPHSAGHFMLPRNASVVETLEYIDRLPEDCPAACVGLAANASIT